MLNRKHRSEDHFSTILAEEIVRSELKKLYGDEIKFFQRVIIATSTKLKYGDSLNECVSMQEHDLLMNSAITEVVTERYVTIKALIGPFERLYPNNPLEDPRRKLRRLDATCRLFCIKTGSVQWQPHFLRFILVNEDGVITGRHGYVYEDGVIDDGRCQKTHDNPCQDMCDSQTTANYPQLHNMA